LSDRESSGPRGATARVQWQTRVLLAVLILVSLGLRLWRIEAKSIWWDESLSLYRAQHGLSYVLSNRIDFPGAATTDLHPPLYFVLLHGFIRIVGESDLSLRFLSVCWAVLLVPLMYVMGARWWGRTTGLWAASLAAVSPFYLWYAQEARMYTMVTCLGLLSAYLLWRAMESGDRLWYVAYVAAAAAMLYTHYFAFLLLVFEVLFWLAWSVRDRRIRIPWVFVLLVAVSFPLAGYALSRLVSGPEVGRAFVPLVSILGDTLNSFSLGVSVRMPEVFALDLLFLALFVLGIWFSGVGDGARSLRKRVFLLGYVFVPVLGLYLASLVKPLYMGSRYMIASSPAFYLGVGAGLTALWRRRRSVAFLVAAFLCSALVFAGIGYSTYNYLFDEHYGTKEDHRSSARHVELFGRSGDLVIVDAPENMPAFSHYYCGELEAVGLPSIALSGHPDPGDVARDVEDAAGDHQRIWLVECRTMFSDPDQLVREWLDRNMFKLDQTRFDSYGSDAVVYLYQPDSPILQAERMPEGSAGAEFGERLLLLEYGLPGGTLETGELATVSLNWCAEKQLVTDYKVSVQMLDEQGNLWAQRDRVPFYFLPTTDWPVGNPVRQEHELRIPTGTPPGRYRLELRVYARDDGGVLSAASEFLRVVDGQAVVLGNVEIVGARAAAKPEDLTLVHRTDATYGGRLRLLGYNTSARKVDPGGTLKLNLHWLALRDMSADYQLELWITHRLSRRSTQLAGWPTSPTYPTSQWQPGEIVRGQPAFELPLDLEPASYELQLLVRDPSGGGALPVWKVGVPWVEVGVELGSLEVRGS